MLVALQEAMKGLLVTTGTPFALSPPFDRKFLTFVAELKIESIVDPLRSMQNYVESMECPSTLIYFRLLTASQVKRGTLYSSG